MAEPVVELLARLVQKDGTRIPAGIWIDDLGDRPDTLRLLDRAACLHALGQAGPRTNCVNLSAATMNRRGSMEWLIAKAVGGECSPSSLVIELTEREPYDLRCAALSVRSARAHGFLTGVDDFGVGYSGFGLFQSIQTDILKADGSFVGEMLRDRSSFLIVEAIFWLAARSGSTVVAEYVESQESIDALVGIARLVERASGCKLSLYGQGFALAVPVPDIPQPEPVLVGR